VLMLGLITQRLVHPRFYERLQRGCSTPQKRSLTLSTLVTARAPVNRDSGHGQEPLSSLILSSSSITSSSSCPRT